MTEIAEATGRILSTSPRRGRAPGRVTFEVSGAAIEVGSYDATLMQQAATSVGKDAKFAYTTKVMEKDGKEVTYLTLVRLDLLDAPESSPEALESTIVPEVIPLQPVPVKVAPTALVGPQVQNAPMTIPQLEAGFALAVRRYELLQDFIRKNFVKNVHFDDGSTFGGKKPVLLQPGAYFIAHAYGYHLKPEIVSGPMEAPRDPNASYTIVIKTTVLNPNGLPIGEAYGSASSTVWSSRQNAYVGRAIDPDKSHNSTLKMAIKRSVVAAVRQSTDAASLFIEDVEEGGYGEEPPQKSFLRR